MNSVRIGLFGVGLDTYWPQFAGLKNRLTGYQDMIARRLSSLDAMVVNGGMVDSSRRAGEVAELFKKEGVELCVLYIATYALSSTVLPVAQ